MWLFLPLFTSSKHSLSPALRLCLWASFGRIDGPRGGAVPRNWTANRNKRYARNVASDRLGSCTLSVPALISSTSAVFQLQVVESDSPSHAGSSEQPSIYKGKVDPQRDHDQRLQPTHESNWVWQGKDDMERTNLTMGAWFPSLRTYVIRSQVGHILGFFEIKYFRFRVVKISKLSPILLAVRALE